MNRTIFGLSNINKWHNFVKDYNIHHYNLSKLSWMNIINNEHINDDIENNYLSQMAYMHSRCYLSGQNINEIENSYNEEDEFLNNMSLIHSRCAKHA
jgi:hypothetical protein